MEPDGGRGESDPAGVGARSGSRRGRGRKDGEPEGGHERRRGNRDALEEHLAVILDHRPRIVGRGSPRLPCGAGRSAQLIEGERDSVVGRPGAAVLPAILELGLVESVASHGFELA